MAQEISFQIINNNNNVSDKSSDIWTHSIEMIKIAYTKKYSIAIEIFFRMKRCQIDASHNESMFHAECMQPR